MTTATPAAKAPAKSARARKSNDDATPAPDESVPAAPTVPETAEALNALLAQVDPDVKNAALGGPLVHPNLTAAVAAVQARLPHVHKSKTATVPGKEGRAGYTYNYADLADVAAAIHPLLGRNGLAFTAKPTLDASNRFVLAYKLKHADSGEEDLGAYPLPDPTRSSAQQVGSAITYARRYTLCCVTGVVPDEDDDGANAATAAPAPPTTAELNAAVEVALARPDVLDALARVRDNFGVPALEAARVAHPDTGELINGMDLLLVHVHAIQEALREQAEAESAAAAQAAAEQGEPAPPQDEQSNAAGAEPERAPDEQPAASERAPESAPDARPDSPARQAEKQQAARPSTTDRALGHVRAEVLFQAEALSVEPRQHVAPLLEQRQVATIEALPAAATGQFLAKRRPEVIEALRAKGREVEADAYAAKGDAPIIVLTDVVGERV